MPSTPPTSGPLGGSFRMKSFLLLVGFVPVTAGASPTVAMNGHLPQNGDVQGMASLGATSVRMDFNWFQFEASANSFDFAAQDGSVQSARQAGLKIYATVAYTPQWASSVPACTPGSSDPTARCENKLPANVSDWTNAVTAVVAHFQGQIDCWGIWNEPNLQGFFDGTEDQFVTQIFSPAAAAVRSADPTARICGPELAGLTASSNWNGQNGQCLLGQCIRNGWEIDLGDMLDRVGTQIDVVTQHFYKGDATTVVSALLDGEYFGSTLTHDSVKHVIASHGAGTKPFWLTETGWEQQPSGSNSPANVASWIVQLYDDEEQVCAGTYAASTNIPWPNWERTFYYDYPCDPTNGWGLVDCSGSPLPPYTALQSWTAGHPSTACGLRTPADAGMAPDAAVFPDASQPVDAADLGGADAAMSIDASAGEDAAPPVDAGGLAGEDAGDSGSVTVPQSDASAANGGPSNGCSCSAPASGAILVPLAFGFALRRKRRSA